MRPTFILLFLAVLFSNFKAQMTANSLKVTLDKPNNRIYYSFNFSGTFYKVETMLYKNSVSTENRIAYGIKEDESDYADIVYPPGYVYNDFMTQTNSSAYEAASQYILIINAYERTAGPVANVYTQTLTYIPPAPPKPDLFIGRIQIFRDKFNVNDFSHLFFDSQNTSQYPGTAFNKNTKYKFVVTVHSSTPTANLNPVLTFSQGLWSNGNYPNNVSKSINTNVPLSNTTEKTVEFFETVINPGQDYVPADFVFHIDKNNTISENNEDNNIRRFNTSLWPSNATIVQKTPGDPEIVKVFNQTGVFLKEYSIRSNEKVEKKIIEDFGAGNYYIQSENNVSRRAKISK